MRAMPLQRTGFSPPYVDFALTYLVQSPVPVPAVVSVLFPAGLTPLVIPTYQRGIEWDAEEVRELLNSNSALFGTVIMANFSGAGTGGLVLELVDGLQRFATVTAFLKSLFPRVLSPQPINLAAAALPEFTALRTKAAGYEPLVSYNHQALMSHPRRAISRGYRKLFESIIEEIVTPELVNNMNIFAVQVQQMMMVKQISIDPYYGFSRHIELANTFLSMNSQGIDLDEADLLRAKLVDHTIGLGAGTGWNTGAIDQMENSFTDTFETTGANSKNMRVLATLIYDAFERHHESSIFPSWNTLQPQNVQTFLSFVDGAIQNATGPNFPYYKEIVNSGGYPFSIALLYYFLPSTTPGVPDFVSNTGISTTNDMHNLLRACYRRLIDGTISRTGEIAVKMLDGVFVNLTQIIQDLNPGGAGPLSGPPNSAWLNQKLRQVDIKRAQRIFNAMLLPDRSNPGATFTPLTFGRRANTFHVDHLIASSLVQQNAPGEIESDTLCNFAPLPSPTNTQQKNAPCSLKLGPHGTISASVAAMGSPHPYLVWLTTNHYASRSHAELNNQSFLEPNSQPPIGDERISYIASVLLNKL